MASSNAPKRSQIEVGGPLGETAITRAVTEAEQSKLERARIARGEAPRSTITPARRVRLEADRARAIADGMDRHVGTVAAGASDWIADVFRASALPAVARFECTTFPSGVTELVIRYANHQAVIHGTAGEDWSYTVEGPTDEGLLVGYHSKTTSLTAAVDAVARHLPAS